jgi:hypothetical protein
MAIKRTVNKEQRDHIMARRRELARELARRPGVKVHCVDGGGRPDEQNTIIWRALRSGGRDAGLEASGLLGSVLKERMGNGQRLAAGQLTTWQARKQARGELSITAFSKSVRRAYYRESKRSGRWIAYKHKRAVALSDADRDAIWNSVADLREAALRGNPDALRALLSGIGRRMQSELRERVPADTGTLRESLRWSLTGSGSVETL